MLPPWHHNCFDLHFRLRFHLRFPSLCPPLRYMSMNNTTSEAAPPGEHTQLQQGQATETMQRHQRGLRGALLHLVDDEVPMPMGGSLPFNPSHALERDAGVTTGGGASGATGNAAVDSAAESRRALAESARLLSELNRQQSTATATNAQAAVPTWGKDRSRRPKSAPAARRQMSGAERLMKATEARRRQRRRQGGH